MSEVTVSSYKGVPANEEAPKILLLGQPGAGKTYSLASLLKAGLEVFVLFTEQGKESLLDGCSDLGVDRSKLHYTRVAAGSPGFGVLKKVARTFNQTSQKDMQSAKGVNERSYDQMIQVISICENFVDQHGVSYGNASDWGNDRVLVIDGLSGINTMCLDLVVGAKPVKTVADWGIAMDAEMRFIHQCANDLVCGFVLLAHLDLSKDEVDGKIYKMPKLLGNKNSYDFGKHFSDVILAEDTGTKYVWSTQEKGMQLKSRNLKKGANLQPTFEPLWGRWASRFEEVNGE